MAVAEHELATVAGGVFPLFAAAEKQAAAGYVKEAKDITTALDAVEGEGPEAWQSYATLTGEVDALARRWQAAREAAWRGACDQVKGAADAAGAAIDRALLTEADPATVGMLEARRPRVEDEGRRAVGLRDLDFMPPDMSAVVPALETARDTAEELRGRLRQDRDLLRLQLADLDDLGEVLDLETIINWLRGPGGEHRDAIIRELRVSW